MAKPGILVGLKGGNAPPSEPPPAPPAPPLSERRQTLLVLREYVRGLPLGARRSWVELETEACVEMSEGNKQLLREAMRAERIAWLKLPGLGIELMGPKNVEEVIDRGIAQIGSAIERGAMAAQHVGRVLPQMSDEDRKRLLLKTAKVDSVRLFLRGG